MNLLRWLIALEKYGVRGLYRCEDDQGGGAIQLVCGPRTNSRKVSRLMQYAIKVGIYDRVLPMLTKLEARVVEVLK